MFRIFFNVLSEHAHSSLIMSPLPTYLPKIFDREWVSEWPPDKKVSLIFLKLCTLKVQGNYMCEIFEFWWNSFFIGMKLNFKFGSWENSYKGFPCKHFFECKFFVKWTQIKIKQYFCKIYCWRSQINSYANPFIKFRRNNFTVKKISMRILRKMNPDQN